MPFLDNAERAFLQAVSSLGYCNPFLPERVECERLALGPEFEEGDALWSLRVDDPDKPRANAWKVTERIEALAPELRERLGEGTSAPKKELALYEDAILYLLYSRYFATLEAADFLPSEQAQSRDRWGGYARYLRDWHHFLDTPGVAMPSGHDPVHTYACFFQIRRAFHFIFTYIIGSSPSAARLRAAVWQSVFSHDMRRYRRTLYERMGDFATLITGPSGTGKELVARAIALSRYLPFDDKKLTFGEQWENAFHPINLAALSPTLIESELFGHRRGAFTGAIQDRRGWLEICPPLGAVFLDEIGDLDPAVQVKLLRVIETRTFQPVGDTTPRRFHGKLIAATHRDLAQAMRQGQFREDFYYRLCSDQITTPPLSRQLTEAPEVLGDLILFMARRVAGDEAEALAAEVEAWVRQNLGPDYGWPGNYRELEQCVRNILIRREYRPSENARPGPHDDLEQAFRAGSMTAEELLGRYCTWVYSKTGSYEETARRLKLDRRTVKSKIDRQWLDKLRQPQAPGE